MIKYMAAAIGLKLFSMNKATRSAYRQIGNSLGQKKRENQSIEAYVTRGDLLVSLVRKYGVLDREFTAVELGTGWIHWFSMYLAMHTENASKLELYDVWDNRQLNALKSSFGELAKKWDADSSVPDEQRARLQDLLQVGSFDELYHKFNANYTVDGEGSLAMYMDNAYDMVFSFHVMEHVGRDIINNSVADMYRMLKPGGYSIHQIGIDDHLTHYDKSESKKKYISYSMGMRRKLFENVVQYHNVLQAQDYIDCFTKAGFEVVEQDREKTDISALSIHNDWKSYSQEDLETTILTVVCRKPLN